MTKQAWSCLTTLCFVMVTRKSCSCFFFFSSSVAGSSSRESCNQHQMFEICRWVDAHLEKRLLLASLLLSLQQQQSHSLSSSFQLGSSESRKLLLVTIKQSWRLLASYSSRRWWLPLFPWPRRPKGPEVCNIWNGGRTSNQQKWNQGNGIMTCIRDLYHSIDYW